MLDHVVLNVKDVAVSTRFYETALAPLGYKLLKAYPFFAGFGAAGKPDFWLAQRPPFHTMVHVAFGVDDRGIVESFHKAGLKAGGKDNGPPGTREIYHPNYYGAFVLDPDGNNIETVCQAPQRK